MSATNRRILAAVLCMGVGFVNGMIFIFQLMFFSDRLHVDTVNALGSPHEVLWNMIIMILSGLVALITSYFIIRLVNIKGATHE